MFPSILHSSAQNDWNHAHATHLPSFQELQLRVPPPPGSAPVYWTASTGNYPVSFPPLRLRGPGHDEPQPHNEGVNSMLLHRYEPEPAPQIEVDALEDDDEVDAMVQGGEDASVDANNDVEFQDENTNTQGDHDTGLVESADEITEDRPIYRRRRDPKNCTECRRRKVKCDRGTPCGPCVRRGDEAAKTCHIDRKYGSTIRNEDIMDKLLSIERVMHSTLSELASVKKQLLAVEARCASAGVPVPSSSYHMDGYNRSGDSFTQH